MLLPLLAPAPKAAACRRTWSIGCQRLAESQDGRERFVDAPLLFGGEPADQVAKPPGVNCADLLNQDAGGLAEHRDLRTERCGLSAMRGGRDQYHRTWQ